MPPNLDDFPEKHQLAYSSRMTFSRRPVTVNLLGLGMFHVALFEPEIAGNTGSIARSCLATGCTLHLIRPLGFRLTDRAVRRAGMDYWDQTPVTVHNSYTAFMDSFTAAYQNQRVFSLTTKGKAHYTDVHYQVSDVLLFGPESRGLPESVRAQTTQLRVPMTPEVRSLNLAISASIVMYEAWRQLGFITQAE
jgi:tRNA (cytidine/uridine-2'-O-)-methyltransferase